MDLKLLRRSEVCPEFNWYVKARAYNKVEYQLNNLELRMEFYI